MISDPIIWGGPQHREVFQRHEVVFVEGFKRTGTIVSDVAIQHAGIQTGVVVKFESGEGLPGNDPVQWAPVSSLRHVKQLGAS